MTSKHPWPIWTSDLYPPLDLYLTSIHPLTSIWPQSTSDLYPPLTSIWPLSTSDLYPFLTTNYPWPPSTPDLYEHLTSIHPLTSIWPLSTPWPLSDLYPAPTRRRIPAPPCRMPTGRRDWPDSTDRHRYTHNLYCFKIKQSYLHLYCNWMKYISLKWLHCANIVRAFKLVLFYRAKAKVVAAV